MQLDIAPLKPARLSLTPLIDVVFILLLFFILTSQLNPWHRQILAQQPLGDQESTVLNVNAKGQILRKEQVVTAQAWPTVGLLVDPDVGAQTLLDVMKRLQQAGNQNIQIIISVQDAN